MKWPHLAVLAIALAVATPLVVASSHERGGQLTNGEVRKVERDARKITIRHAPIVNLDMPAMTMVFRVKDPAMLDQVKPGDRIRFSADKVGGYFTVTHLESAK